MWQPVTEVRNTKFNNNKELQSIYVALSLSKIFLTISGLRVIGIIAAAFGVLTDCMSFLQLLLQ